MSDAGEGIGLSTDLKFTDINQKEWELMLLTARDFVEFERYLAGIGATMLDWAAGKHVFECAVFLMFLGLRRKGLTKQQIRDQKWAIEIEDVYDMLSPAHLTIVTGLSAKLIEKSGFGSLPAEAHAEPKSEEAKSGEEKAADQEEPEAVAAE